MLLKLAAYLKTRKLFTSESLQNLGLHPRKPCTDSFILCGCGFCFLGSNYWSLHRPLESKIYLKRQQQQQGYDANGPLWTRGGGWWSFTEKSSCVPRKNNCFLKKVFLIVNKNSSDPQCIQSWGSLSNKAVCKSPKLLSGSVLPRTVMCFQGLLSRLMHRNRDHELYTTHRNAVCLERVRGLRTHGHTN